jgi:hypothetical protein
MATADPARLERIAQLTRDRGISRWRLQRKVEKLDRFLEAGEEVVEVGYARAGATFIGGLTGKVIVACTDRRVVFPSVVWGEALRFDEIASVEAKTFPTKSHGWP